MQQVSYHRTVGRARKRNLQYTFGIVPVAFPDGRMPFSARQTEGFRKYRVAVFRSIGTLAGIVSFAGDQCYKRE